MSDDEKLPHTLHSALHLDGSPEAIKNFYADWAEQYNDDTADWRYAAPANALLLLKNLAKSTEVPLDIADPSLKIMDAGCGTGLIGKVLRQSGYNNIHGFDISPEMVKIARETGAYKELEGNIDLNAPIKTDWLGQFDCTFSIGVFTSGHVQPAALTQLARLTRQGGIVIMSARVSYYESEKFQEVSDRLEAEGAIKLLHKLENAAYTEDEAAHYFAYRVM